MGVKIKKGSRDPNQAHQGLVCHRKASTWYILPAYEI